MASNPDFVQFIIDQCTGAGEIAVKKMVPFWWLLAVSTGSSTWQGVLKNAQFRAYRSTRSTG